MLDHLSGWHLLVLAVVGLILFGPTRLPTVVRDAARTVRHLRAALHEATADMRAELGPEMAGLNLTELQPRRLVANLLADDPAPHATEARASRVSPIRDGEIPPYDLDAT